MKHSINIFWFRRDLRLNDNHGLFEALQAKSPVLPIFIFDSNILERLPKDDARVTFIHETLQKISKKLQKEYNSGISMFLGKPIVIFKQLLETYTIESIYTNHDYEPYAKERDSEIETFLGEHNVNFKTYKDQVVFEKNEITKADGKPYLVYTPYMKRWKETFRRLNFKTYTSETLLSNLISNHDFSNLSIADIGFIKSSQTIEPYNINPNLIENYEDTRNFPAQDSTSKLGPHLRFGTVSIRNMVKKATAQQNEIFWQELIWREFFTQILWHFPQTHTESFKPQYDRIVWRNNETEFKAWCEGKTGYPLVDAGMRQLNKTGFMHNRVRMLAGSFLCKHLLIDWRWGEAYFAEKLHDYDMASNIGNWQWVAGCGVDAAPYFRIFNPTTQIEKFDKKLEYIKQWLPDFQELTYPTPIVDHKMARERCLKTYKEALV
ncbi:cryptochrome/photolyase family protein [Thalassobellus sediminis]|uniref:cryptochrome/photolyase family protein n=1 Tax=Thalassobellus sediminis TaxID=3367753 RepID=UPI003787769D